MCFNCCSAYDGGEGRCDFSVLSPWQHGPLRQEVRSSDLPLLRWHGGGDHRGTEQAKIVIDSIF